MFHSYPGLLKRLHDEQQKEPPNENLIRDLSAAIQVVQEEEAKTLMDYHQLTCKGEITFSLLWTLFTPNSLVYNFHHYTEQGRILLVRSTAYKEKQDGSKCLKISCDILHNSGDDFGLARQTLIIDSYSGIYPIRELTAYPLKFHAERDEIYARAVEFGKKYIQLPRHKYCEIVGHAMRDLPGGEQLEKYYVSFHAYFMYLLPLTLRP